MGGRISRYLTSCHLSGEMLTFPHQHTATSANVSCISYFFFLVNCKDLIEVERLKKTLLELCFKSKINVVIMQAYTNAYTFLDDQIVRKGFCPVHIHTLCSHTNWKDSVTLNIFIQSDSLILNSYLAFDLNAFWTLKGQVRLQLAD